MLVNERDEEPDSDLESLDLNLDFPFSSIDIDSGNFCVCCDDCGGDGDTRPLIELRRLFDLFEEKKGDKELFSVNSKLSQSPISLFFSLINYHLRLKRLKKMKY